MKTVTYKLNLIRPDLASGSLRLAFLTDLHNSENGPDNEDLLNAIREAGVDLILCGGDMLVGDVETPITIAKDLVLKLAADYPIYHALGNHEHRLKLYPHQYGPKYEEYKESLEQAGVIFLDNEQELITVRGIPLMISGYSLPKQAYTRVSRASLDASRINQELGAADRKVLNILLAHTPEYMPAYTNWGADLTLCGHFHGGIIRLGEHTGLITPNVKLFNGKCHGQYDFHSRITSGITEEYDSHIIVSAGLGEHTLPLRFHNPRELVIVEIEISKGEKENKIHGHSGKASGV